MATITCYPYIHIEYNYQTVMHPIRATETTWPYLN